MRYLTSMPSERSGGSRLIIEAGGITFFKTMQLISETNSSIRHLRFNLNQTSQMVQSVVLNSPLGMMVLHLTESLGASPILIKVDIRTHLLYPKRSLLQDLLTPKRSKLRIFKRDRQSQECQLGLLGLESSKALLRMEGTSSENRMETRLHWKCI